jgi:hypothetical protein
MALGAVAKVTDGSAPEHGSATLYAHSITIVGDNSYPAGGSASIEAAVQAQVGDGKALLALLPQGGNDGYVAYYDQANDKLIVYYADYDAVADGALIEVAATTDLSTTTFTLLALMH